MAPFCHLARGPVPRKAAESQPAKEFLGSNTGSRSGSGVIIGTIEMTGYSFAERASPLTVKKLYNWRRPIHIRSVGPLTQEKDDAHH